MKFSVLPEWKTIGITKTVAATVVQVDFLTKLLQCWHCGASSELLREEGKIELKVRDVPMRDKPVELSLSRRRYVCSNCNSTSLQPMPEVDEGLRATARLVELVAKRALKRPCRQVAAELGLSEYFVRAAFFKEVKRLESLECCEAPHTLTLDLIYVNGRERVLLTDAESDRVIGITADASMMTAQVTLLRLPRRERVEVVTIPMCRPFRIAASQILPRARLIVDRFEVMKLGNDAFEEVRKRAPLLSSRPEDGKVLAAAAFFLRARFIDVFRTASNCVARRRYAEWVAALPEELMFAFGPMVRTVNCWSEHIFGYFDHHFPEANPEATNHSAEVAPPDEQGAGSQQILTQDERDAVTG
jgi:transposase